MINMSLKVEKHEDLQITELKTQNDDFGIDDIFAFHEQRIGKNLDTVKSELIR